MNGLPPDAAVWRRDGLPFSEEAAALLVERLDAWARVFVDLRCGKRVRLPSTVQIVRPGQKPPEPQIETDPGRIAQFFRAHINS